MAKSTHYGQGTQSGAGLRKFGAYHARVIRLMLDFSGKSYPVLLYRGMSGIQYATAISMEYARAGEDIGMIYVRKPEEHAHGKPIETNVSKEQEGCLFFFVDDFISSGHTILETIKEVRKSRVVKSFDEDSKVVALTASIRFCHFSGAEVMCKSYYDYDNFGSLRHVENVLQVYTSETGSERGCVLKSWLFVRGGQDNINTFFGKK